MKRIKRLRIVLFFLGCMEGAAGQPGASTRALDSSHHVPEEKGLTAQWKKDLWASERKVYRGEELTTIGMPCGGIAAGQLYVRGDGTLANWWICNNAYNTGYGKDSLMNFKTAQGPWKVCYQTFRPAGYVRQGFSALVRQDGKTMRRRLDRSGFDDISFVGEYPIATVHYGAKNWPVDIRMDVYSPFVPMEARESATPGTILRFTIKNSSARPLSVELTGWLQNLVCLDLKDSVIADARNRVVRGRGMVSVMMDLVKAQYKDGRRFEPNHPYQGNLALSVLDEKGVGDADYQEGGAAAAAAARERAIGDPLQGAVGSTVQLKPGESREVRFLLTWYFPNRPSYYYGDDVTKVIDNDWNEALPVRGATIIGNMYGNWYRDALDVASWLQSNYERLSRATRQFHDTYYNNTSLPYWLVQRLLMPVSTLATETCQWWANDKFWAWEGVGSCVGTCTHVWNYEQALARLFPELERNIRERTDYGTSFQADGSVLARNGWGDVLIDGHAGAILKAYREHLFSKDGLFLTRNWPRIKKAMEYLIGQDENGDGLIEKQQANTYDIAFYGANTYVGGLYLAALKAASQMAELMHDTAAVRWSAIFARGRDNTVKKLWTGRYFRQDVDLKAHPSYQYADGCLSDQLFGQTWTDLLGLGYIYPTDNVREALASIWKYNWAPDVASQNRVHPPERVYADPGEAGLLVCTWPYSRHMGEEGVRYRDEVWTGIEYQVATGMIYEGMTEEGLSIVKAVHDRYNGTKHNPWNEIECGDHYARAMASWGVLMALEDYQYDGPGKEMRWRPRVGKEHFSGFFTSAEGWGVIGQERDALRQVNSLDCRYGRVALTKLVTEVDRPVHSVKLQVDGRPVAARFRQGEGHAISVEFEEIVIGQGQKLKVLYE